VTRFAIALGLVAVAAAIAYIVQRRRPDAPTQTSWSVPAQLDRADFASPEVAWLIVVFSSATCGICEAIVAKAMPLASDDVVVQEVEFSADRDLHERYHIDAVPTLVVADARGVVRASFVGSVVAAELWSVVSDLRDNSR